MGESDHRVSKSLYAKDPSGIEFEVMWRVPAEDWAAETADGDMILPLDLDAAIARWGQDQATGAAAGSTHVAPPIPPPRRPLRLAPTHATEWPRRPHTASARHPRPPVMPCPVYPDQTFPPVSIP